MSIFQKLGFYRLELPEGWEVDEEDEPPAITHVDGCGALHITVQSVRRQKPEERIDAFLWLRAFLRGTDVNIDETEARRYSEAGLEWASSEYGEQDPEQGPVWWRAWVATNHELVAVLTYASRREDKDVERWAVDGIVKSLELA